MNTVRHPPADAYRDNTDYLADLVRLAQLRAAAYAAGEPSAYRQADMFQLAMQDRVAGAAEDGIVIGLPFAFSLFELTAFEQHCVMMSLAAELDGTLPGVYQELTGSRLPSVGFCVDAFIMDAEERIALAGEPLTGLKNIFCYSLDGAYLCSHLDLQLKVEPRIVDFAQDIGAGDAGLEGLARMFWPWEPIAEPVANADVPRRIVHISEAAGGPVLFYLHGAPGSGRRFAARHACRDLDMPLLVADAGHLIESGEALSGLLGKLCRECRLRQSALCLASAGDILLNSAHLHALIAALPAAPTVVFLTGEVPWQPDAEPENRAFAAIELPSPDVSGRIAFWRSALENDTLGDDVAVEEIAAKFSFTGGQIMGAAQSARLLMQSEGETVLRGDLLHRACRGQISHRLGERATLIPVRYTWDDLILPPLPKGLLREACNQVRFNHRVYGEWGFGEKMAYGRGLSMLFSGPPGTGKTMGAQVVANELQLEIYKVDLSAVVSKYIGETEKNLSDIFAEVKRSQSILFFDEADALFGKRSEVKDAHDKYANIETAYLLQKMEEYEGIVILATNFIQNFDEAFKRRIKYLVEFPFPDADYRLRMWRAVFPDKLPIEDNIDYDYLAETFLFSGSNIKNVAISAAFLAASEDTCVTMHHILKAVVAETRKAGKVLLREDLREYYYILDGAYSG